MSHSKARCNTKAIRTEDGTFHPRCWEHLPFRTQHQTLNRIEHIVAVQQTVYLAGGVGPALLRWRGLEFAKARLRALVLQCPIDEEWCRAFMLYRRACAGRAVTR